MPRIPFRKKQGKRVRMQVPLRGKRHHPLTSLLCPDRMDGKADQTAEKVQTVEKVRKGG